jgi:filamentous hemagglutinin family protein
MSARRGFLLAAFALVAGVGSARAQIVTDSTLPSVPSGFVVPAKDGRFMIADGLGVIKGANRFHSFSEFGVPSGQRVVFASDSALKNILTRVTGGSVSRIEGVLESRVEGANLFLINPSGICFLSGASLELTGDFNASLADYVVFEDGGRFDASHPDQTVLTSAAPSAFGFLDGPAGLAMAANAEECERSQLQVTKAILGVADGKSLRLVGGDVAVESLSSSPREQAALKAPGGQVVLAAVKSAGEVPLDVAPGCGPLPMPVQGTIRLTGRASVDASPEENSAQNGRVVIRGGILRVENGQITSDSHHSGGGLTVDVAMTEDVTVTGLNGAIQSDSFAPEGTPAEASIMARNLEVARGTIRVQAHAGGEGTILRVAVEEDLYLHDGLLLLDTRTAEQATGGGATVTVKARNFEVQSGTLSLDNNGRGPGATLEFQANQVTLDGSTIFVGTFGPGPGGTIRLGTESQPIQEVRLSAGSRILADAGQLSGGKASGPAGKVEVHARTIEVDGSSPAPTGFFAEARGTGTAEGGTITIHADQSMTLSGANAMVSSSTISEAPGGTIWIAAGSLGLDQGASIRSASTGQGAAGTVNIIAQDSVTLRDKAVISAAGPKGGDISLCAGNQIYLLDSQLSASSSSGTGGNVFLGLPPSEGWPDAAACLAPVFVIMNLGILNASSAGGVGGNVTVSTRYYLPSGDSPVNVTGTEGTGTPSTPVGLDFSGDLATPIQARPEDLAEAKEQKDFQRPPDPAGYTPVGRRDDWETGVERRLILDRSPERKD